MSSVLWAWSDVVGLVWSQVRRWAQPLTSHITKHMLPRMLALQTQTLTNPPTDIQRPILVTVHLAGEQTGKTITTSSKVTYWDTWLDQTSADVHSPYPVHMTKDRLAFLLPLLWIFKNPQRKMSDDKLLKVSIRDKACKNLLNYNDSFCGLSLSTEDECKYLRWSFTPHPVWPNRTESSLWYFFHAVGKNQA